MEGKDTGSSQFLRKWICWMLDDTSAVEVYNRLTDAFRDAVYEKARNDVRGYNPVSSAFKCEMDMVKVFFLGLLSLISMIMLVNTVQSLRSGVLVEGGVWVLYAVVLILLSAFLGGLWMIIEEVF